MPSTILSNINEDLGPSPSYSWITVSWNLVAAVVVTVSGRLADIFGRRYFLITGAIFGCIGALVGATAQSINQMIASGVLFGVGGGFQEMCYSCIQELVPNKWRILTIGKLASLLRDRGQSKQHLIQCYRSIRAVRTCTFFQPTYRICYACTYGSRMANRLLVHVCLRNLRSRTLIAILQTSIFWHET